MKVLAINGSPRGKYGNTEVLIRNFMEGCSEAGAETETIYLADKKIHSCSGCFTCWTKTPGKCIFQDDMNELLEKRSQADVIVYGTPLYYFTYSGIMKNFIDRLLPLVRREIVPTYKGYSHNCRNQHQGHSSKSVLISNCGFPGNDNFSGLAETFKVWHRHGNIAGMILISQGGALSRMETDEYLSKLYAPFIEALKDAGKEVVTCGHISSKTQELLDKKYMPPQVYVENANKSWDK